jgi:hypothetical protein
MRLVLRLAVLASLSFALPAAADTIRGDHHHGDADDSDLVVTNVELHPSHDVHPRGWLRHDDNDNAQWDEDSTNNNDSAQGDEDSNDNHDGFAASGTDSDAADGPSNPTPQNDPVATPEPNALLLLGIGIAMAAVGKRSLRASRAA